MLTIAVRVPGAADPVIAFTAHQQFIAAQAIDFVFACAAEDGIVRHRYIVARNVFVAHDDGLPIDFAQDGFFGWLIAACRQVALPIAHVVQLACFDNDNLLILRIKAGDVSAGLLRPDEEVAV